ncbi:uncharacterized protein LOC116733782 [Xiphophorus hellerii]|uniref:uncharacterized protein LOC116733782 n=1 Tax=Xiphophorus hellerii TaxID=8084 RepID=UPI0013B36484|nr:uncharacterized protein LOC116733782 [Xiphophorus hellerii]
MATSSQPISFGYEKLSVALLNINGLRNKIDQIQDVIKHCKLHVVALCETKLDPSVDTSHVYIPGFRMWRRDRNEKGGGVFLYVQDHIEARSRPDLMNPQIEIIWVEMKLLDKPVLLGCCYRSPKSKPPNLNQIHEMMTRVSGENKDIFLMGDFNIDWFSDSKRKKTADVISRLGWSQIVKDATRVEGGSVKCIDHIYTNIPDLCSASTGPRCSDHNLVTVTVRRYIPQRIRRSNICSKKRFKNDMKRAMEKVCEELDPKKAQDKFTDIFLSVADKYAPLESQDIYGSLTVDEKTKTLMYQRHKAKEHIINKRHIVVCEYKEDIPRLGEGEETEQEKQHGLNNSEERQMGCFQQQPEEAPKQFFGKRLCLYVINLTPEEDITSETEQIHQTNTRTTDVESVSECFQAEQIIQIKPDAFSFGEIDADTVQKLLVYLCDHVIHVKDQTEAELMKLAADHISAPICHILNRCRLTKLMPDDLKNIKTFPFSGSQQNGADNVHVMLGFIYHIIISLRITHCSQ